MRTLVALVAATSLAGCAAGGSPSSANSATGETFRYAPAQDGTVRVSVDEVRMRGNPGYLPKDNNWLQMRITVSNVGRYPVQVTDIKGRLENGTQLASARSAGELAKPPNIASTVGKSTGLMLAGQAAGYLLFPPLALLGGVASSVNLVGGAGSLQKRAESITAGMLQPQNIAPGSHATGDVYIPAVRGQTGLVVFYTAGSSSRSLALQRLQ